MGAKTLFLIKTHFILMSKKMLFLIRVLWTSFFISLFTLFGFIGRRIFRLPEKLLAENSSMKQLQQGEEEEEESKSLLRFRFPTFEEFAQKNDVHFIGDQGLPVHSGVNSDANCVSSENVVGLEPVENIVEPPQISSGVNSDANCLRSENVAGLEPVENIVEPPQICSDVSMIDRKSSEYKVEMIVNKAQEIGDSKRDLMSVTVDDMEVNSKEIETENLGEPSQMVDNLVNNVDSVRHDAHFVSDDESFESDSDSDSMVSSNSSFRSSFIDSLSDGFLSDIDFQRAFEIDTFMEYGSSRNVFSKVYGWNDLDDEDEDEDEDILQELKDIEHDLQDDHDSCDDLDDEDEDVLQEIKDIEHDLQDDLDDEDEDVLEELKEMESPSEQSAENQSPSSETHNVIDESVSGGRKAENELVGEQQNKESSLVDESEWKQNSEKSSSGEVLSSDSDEQNGLEREWEHQDLVEQLKMEIKKVQAIGLPTILEESESPKIMDDLKPWKIEHKFHHEGTMDELNIFYKSYREKMRKLDILNFQKMYAIGFLSLKDPLQSFTKDKISIPTLSAIVSLSCWPCKPKPSSEIHPPLMKKFSKELESDLEMVYVGQMCLSWEFLCWEYGKALELWESDPHGILHYNEVAEKFQIFQVLLTRFLEEELFEGPRVQHYVKNRCVLRNLLQVPVVRDDNYRNRKKEKKVISRKEAVTSLQLVEIIEESIRILWQLIRTDKDASNAGLVKYRRSSSVKLQSPADVNLLAELRSSLLKKDKKLKELTRSENCVLRSIRRHQEDDSDHVLHFFSRVDLKLVSRVLNMARLSTEQLVWCSDKLHRINFVGRKLHIEVEPSILLFPCS